MLFRSLLEATFPVFCFFRVVHYVIQHSYIFSNKSTEIKPVWSSFIIDGSTTLSLFAMQDEAYLYDVFNSEIGRRQFFNNKMSLFPFGLHVIISLGSPGELFSDWH